MLIDREKPLGARVSRAWQVGALGAGAMILTAAVLLLGLPRASAQPEGEAPPAAENPLELPPPDPASEPPGAAPAPPPVAPAEAPSLEPAESPGRLEIRAAVLKAIDEIQVPAQTGGVLVELLVQEGARVEKGQLLARIDDRDAQLALAAAKARLARARTEEVALKAAQLEAEQAKREFERIRELAQQAAVSQSELASAKMRLERAQLQVEQAEEELTAARLLAEIEVAAAGSQVAKCQVTAPFSGTIVETPRKQGEWVKPGDPICRLMGLERLAVEGLVPASQLTLAPARLAGREVMVIVKTFKEDRRGGIGSAEREVAGKVSYVAPVFQAGDRLRILAVIPNLESDGSYVLLPGMPATIVVKTD